MADNTASNELPSVVEFSQPIDEAEAPKALPEGDYVASVTGVTQKVSSNSGKNYAEVILTIDPANFPVDFEHDGQPQNVKYFISTEDTQWARFAMREAFEAFGAKPPKKTVDLTDLLGRSAIITTVHNEFPKGSGRVSSNVKTVKKAA
jgi:hypothetical protein